jgi:hypothetical protein
MATTTQQERSSEPRMLISDRLPMPAGTSPFRVKGHVYQKMLEDFRTSTGVDALLRWVKDDDIARFVEQQFTAAGWYDALPMMPLSVAHARVHGIPFHQHLRDRGRWVAEQDVPGIYRFLFKLASPEVLVSRLPRAATTYFDFGESEVKTLRPRHVLTYQSGVPAMLVPLVAATTEGFVAAALEMAGARRPQVRCIATPKDGDRAGLATMTVCLEVTWS